MVLQRKAYGHTSGMVQRNGITYMVICKAMRQIACNKYNRILCVLIIYLTTVFVLLFMRPRITSNTRFVQLRLKDVQVQVSPLTGKQQMAPQISPVGTRNVPLPAWIVGGASTVMPPACDTYYGICSDASVGTHQSSVLCTWNCMFFVTISPKIYRFSFVCLHLFSTSFNYM